MRTDDSLFEILEPRMLMAGADDLPFTLYYPEGYTHDAINEFVPITNPNEFEVEYEVHARYEVGERDQLLASGTIAPSTRGGITINRSDLPGDRVVRPDTPYALVLKASARVSATLSHYDFGTAIGESFTESTSTEWSFGEGYKDHGWTRDFVVFYNPGDDSVEVELEIHTGDGQTIHLRTRVEGQRRGGWSLDAEDAVPAGTFGMRVIASAPIVAALSHYEIVTGRGFGALGTTDGGATAGFIPAIDFHHSGGDDGGGGDDDGTPDQGGGNDDDYPSNSYLTVLNSGEAPATVTFTFLKGDDDTPGAVEGTRVITVAPNSRSGISIRDLGFPDTDHFGVAYRSDLPVTVTAAVYAGRDATGLEAITIGATVWDFAEGFMSRIRAGRGVTEDIYVFNPNNFEVRITLDFLLWNGQVVTVHKSLDPLEIEDVKAHVTVELTDIAPDVFYGVHLEADGPVVSAMEHWDRDLGGGFGYAGIASGDVFALADILAL